MAAEGIEDSLLKALRNRLADQGFLERMRSEMRAAILNDVRDGKKSPINALKSKGSNSPTQLVNNLVLEYLQWMGFQYSGEMLATESGAGVPSRGLLEAKLKLKENVVGDKELPLLLSLVMKAMKDEEKI